MPVIKNQCLNRFLKLFIYGFPALPAYPGMQRINHEKRLAFFAQYLVFYDICLLIGIVNAVSYKNLPNKEYVHNYKDAGKIYVAVLFAST